MKIAFFELKDWEKKYFADTFKDKAELIFYHTPLTEAELPHIKDIEILVIFTFSHITKEFFDQLPNLKYIITMSTGYDHIDLDTCKMHNIVVSNIPTYGEITVAEHAFALIFAISRRIVESVEKVKAGEFSPEGLTGFDLSGRTLGVIGVGNIGKHVIRIAKGIGMNVLGYKRSPDPALEQELGFKIVDLDNLLSQSDIITLHLPYTEENHYFLSKEKFDKMKDAMVVINTARGPLLDTAALLEALDSGKVYAAGLDVLEEEPILKEEKELLSHEFDKEALMHTIENHMLLRHPRVIITPHNAFNSEEALNRIVKTTEENINAFISGTPINLVSNHS